MYIKMEPYISVGKVPLPNKPLSNFELIKAAKKLKISNFRGIYLGNTLRKQPNKNECGALNLDHTSRKGLIGR